MGEIGKVSRRRAIKVHNNEYLVEKKKALTGIEGLASRSTAPSSPPSSASISEHETASFQSRVGRDETQRSGEPKWRESVNETRVVEGKEYEREMIVVKVVKEEQQEMLVSEHEEEEGMEEKRKERRRKALRLLLQPKVRHIVCIRYHARRPALTLLQLTLVYLLY